MIDFSFTPDQEALRQEVEVFAAGLNVGVRERDRAAEFPYGLWKQCADFGLLSMSVPAQFNTTGEDTDLISGAVAMEALGHACRDNGLTYALATHMWTVQHPIAMYGSDVVKERYLPAMCRGELVGAHAITEPEAGSDHAAIATVAERVDGGYRVTGHKRFITFAPIADVALILATIDPDQGRWGLTSFLVDTSVEGCERSNQWDKMGLRSVPMGDLRFDGCFVPEEQRLGPEGAGGSIAAASLGRERAFIVATNVGAMQRQLEESIDYAQNRKQFGQPIGKFQAVSNRIADMRLSLETARLLLYKVIWMIEQGEDVTMEAALLKLHLSESFVETSLDSIRIHGGRGYLAETGVERDLRDAVGGLIYAGTSDIQRVIVSRMLGL